MSPDDTKLAPAAARRRTLGKGLGALLGEAAEDYAQLDQVRPAKATPIELLAPGPFQPRIVFEPAALADLAQSIREKGILQPILVRRNPDQPGNFQIIAGERRWRAAQQAGLREVPVIVRDFTDGEALEVSIIENVQRQDLNAIEEAHGYERLIKEYGHTQEDVARLVGKSRPYIANTLRLLKLPPEIMAKVESGELSAGHARAILAAGDDPELSYRILSGQMNVREAEQAVQEAKLRKVESGQSTAKGIKLRDANTVALEKELSDMLGLSVNISGKGPKGTLMIRYQNLDQLEDLIQRLCGKSLRA